MASETTARDLNINQNSLEIFRPQEQVCHWHPLLASVFWSAKHASKLLQSQFDSEGAVQ
jgi:hypothetical protein